MSKDTDKRVVYKINDSDTSSNVTIPENALESITCFATLGVDGVYSVGGNIKLENRSKVGDGGVSGIKVEINDKVANIYIAIEMLYGYNIPTLSKTIQENVKTTIENMTDFVVNSVNIKVTNIVFDK